MSVGTKDRIILSAELLFARDGFENTSLRMITRHANVNIASVNYHFGSKKNLIQAVLARYLDVFIPHIASRLSINTNRSETTVEQLVNYVLASVLEVENLYAGGASNFLQLLGRGYTEAQGHLRKFILSHYGETVRLLYLRFIDALPNVDVGEIFWRLHFALGTLVFSMASKKALSEIAVSDYSQNVSIESMVRRLSAFIAKGIS